jgi:uncharacterized alpha-E superfamily protein
VGVSLLRSVGAARENARSMREVISLEVFECIHELHLYLNSLQGRDDFEHQRYGFYRHVRREAQLALGLLRGTMLDDMPLWFCWLGVLLERVGQTARILDVHHHTFTTAQKGRDPAHPVAEVALWLSLLRACYGFEPFMKSHRGAVTPPAVASFLIFERRFPRAVRHGLERVRELLLRVRPTLAGPPPAALLRLEDLEEWLDGRKGLALDANAVHETLTKVVDETHAICDLVQSEVIAAAPARSAAPEQSQTQTQTQGTPAGP